MRGMAECLNSYTKYLFYYIIISSKNIIKKSTNSILYINKNILNLKYFLKSPEEILRGSRCYYIRVLEIKEEEPKKYF